MKRLIVSTAIVLALAAPAKADDVGAVFGGVSGFLLAGPPGAIIGIIIGGVWGNPWWGGDHHDTQCYIDREFRRHCPKFPTD